MSVLYGMTLMRLITLRSATFARSVRISFWTPSAKNAFSLSVLKFSKGNTAMLLSRTGGTGARAGVTLLRWKNAYVTRARATNVKGTTKSLARRRKNLRTLDGFIEFSLKNVGRSL